MTEARHKRFAIIMAGGRGERFWPLSRESTPKQL
ncbi:MAG: sugar phosphate nucleotidyltransferase, partial [Verrucomicrobiota bacterium]|nr:sugar phosphate nucleotidyltransferase [Verrucomicrobiota bacterium]